MFPVQKGRSTTWLYREEEKKNSFNCSREKEGKRTIYTMLPDKIYASFNCKEKGVKRKENPNIFTI